MRVTRLIVGITSVLAAVVLMLELGGPALADPNSITVGGVWVCNITHDASGMTAAERIVQVRQRITNVLSTDRFRSNPKVFVRVHAAGPDAIISVGDPQGQVVVFTVTPQDAVGTSLTPVQLARQWAPRLAQGLGQAMPSSYWNIPGHIYLF